MQAYGGVLGMQATQKNAVGAIESGPAAGVVGSHFLGRLTGENNILATDMGGTTFKVSVIRDGQIERDYKPVFMRYNILSPKIWVESIGAGGGSIAWIDEEMGLLKVGPEGAGAKPGPVCYGLGGTDPTVSDANLVLGYLNENYFLGGRMKLDKQAAIAAIREKIAKPLGLTESEAASGIFRIATAHMSDLIRKATVERGYDPRGFVMFAYGGAAPIHASRYAAQLGVKKVIIPVTASVHGATGLISSDVVYEYGKSDHLVVPANVARVNQNFTAMVQQALNDLHAAGFADGDIKITRSVDIRYRYQVHELNVPFEAGIDAQIGALLVGLLVVTLLFLSHLALKKKGLAIFVTGLVIVMVQAGAENPWLEIPVAVVFAALALTALVRTGVLGLVLCLLVSNILAGGPLTLDVSRWYAGHGWFLVAIAMAIVAWGFHTSLRGRPLFGGAALDD